MPVDIIIAFFVIIKFVTGIATNRLICNIILSMQLESDLCSDIPINFFQKAVWVNSISPRCDLADTRMGQAILTAASDSKALASECRNYAGKKNAGDVMMTDSYNRLCTSIIHCICHQQFKSKQVVYHAFHQ